MDDRSNTTGPVSSENATDRRASAEGQLAKITSLLQELEAQSSAPPPIVKPEFTRAQENELPLVRLGIAGGLYTALAAKHEPTAKHCLRVALGCSAWASKVGLDEDMRDDIELAALLHDIGKIGVPDNVLLKPGSLTPQEVATMEGHWQAGLSILRCCCASQGVAEIVRYARTWFDGSRGAQESSGEGIPLGARMLSIVDAFDAMMTDHVYRRALPLERAYNELLRFAGTQFDPSLVVLFIKLYESDQFAISHEVSRRWLHELDPEMVQAQWRRSESRQWVSSRLPETMFQQKLLDNMHDGVVFIDNNLRIILWNHGAERLTGIPASSVVHRMFLPSVLKMRDEHGKLVKDDDCPVAHATQTGIQWLRRLLIKGRTGREMAVDAHAVPVSSNDGAMLGLTLLLHDASSEISLEERCQNLHEIATRDPLTQVANRAEFDRVHSLFVAAHLESKRPCSLIICDIDRFKRINDTFGHPAGDAVIQSFAKILQNSCRPGDLVARYGGEEFVMLCADCDNATAARRADEIRVAFCEFRQPALDSQCAAASFGVTEVQPGDTPETMLHRADRGLLLAKETGRNKVIQLGAGNDHGEENSRDTVVQHTKRSNLLLMQDMTTQAPIDRTIDKLRGFIADHRADILSIDGRRVQIKMGSVVGALFRRSSDREIPVIIDVMFDEDVSEVNEATKVRLSRTRIHLEVRPQRARDRRRTDAIARARQLAVSLRAYLMATDTTPKVGPESVDEEALARVRSRNKPGWLGRLFGGKSTQPEDDR